LFAGNPAIAGLVDLRAVIDHLLSKTTMKWHRILAELDLHYLVIVLLISLLMLFGFGELWSPGDELLRASVAAAAINVAAILLSFIALAPWSLSRPWPRAVIRCASWIATNFVLGSVLTFLILSTRALVSWFVQHVV
jgi:hypothetical protein